MRMAKSICQILVTFLLAANVFRGVHSCVGAWSQADADRVEALPGQPLVAFNLFAGNVTVDTAEGRDLFYVFAECSNDTSRTRPLVLWLNGGPGCSSLGSGFAQENGPFRIVPGGSGLAINAFAWKKGVNIIWLDSPTGVGFSYSRLNMTANVAGGDTRTSEDAYNFLVGWLGRFPEYHGRDFYITGESYAGHYVPQLAELIVKRNAFSPFKINLKGYMIFRRGLRSRGYDPCTANNAEIYFNRQDVQLALHANSSGVVLYPWTQCSGVMS